MPRIVYPGIRTSLLMLSLALLTRCTLPGWMPLGDETPGQTLAPNTSVNLHFFTNMPNRETGIRLQSGATYALEFRLLSHWIDSYIDRNENDAPLDETGFANSLMPADWMGVLRRSRSHNWFEFMLVQPACKSASLRGISDLDYDAASKRYRFTAACDGNLTFYVNDAFGFYGNNAGFANIGLARLN